MASGNLVGSGVILGVLLSLDATQWEPVVSIACCLQPRGRDVGVALSVILFFFRCGLFFLEVVFFLRSQSLFLKRCFIFFRFAADYFLESHLKFWSLSTFFFRCFVLNVRCFVFLLEVLLFFHASKKNFSHLKKIIISTKRTIRQPRLRLIQPTLFEVIFQKNHQFHGQLPRRYMEN